MPKPERGKSTHEAEIDIHKEYRGTLLSFMTKWVQNYVLYDLVLNLP